MSALAASMSSRARVISKVARGSIVGLGRISTNAMLFLSRLGDLCVCFGLSFCGGVFYFVEASLPSASSSDLGISFCRICIN